MATKYNDIITLRSGKAAYNIENEKSGEWTSFIPNEQFNDVLCTVIKSVRGNNVDFHKPFWINGTYGTGKSHAVSVISHLLCDEIDELRSWIDYEYGAEKYTQLRNDIYSLRENKRLLTVKLLGLNAMTHSSDLAPILQRAVVNTLRAQNIEINVPTDFEVYIEHITNNTEIWEPLIKSNTSLLSIVANTQELINNLKDDDLKTFHCVKDALRESRLMVRMDNIKLKRWLIEVQDKLRELGMYNGILIVWDEFTDVMADVVGVAVLKELQDIAEELMNIENDSYIFLISHPSALDKLGSEQLKQTDGRYHRMKYNMESVSAFKIMSRKFEITDKVCHSNMRQQFYRENSNLLDVFIQTSNDPQSTKEDLFNLFPLHPGTANLATHYATVIGSSSRSVFEFLGQNDAISEFLNSEEHYNNHDTISADFLWDFVLKVFQDDVRSYGPVTERYNSYVRQVETQGVAHLAIFKGVLLLNAFNNVAGDNNNGLITPSEENIHFLFDGTRYANQITEVLNWFNDNGVIQRAPGGMFSVQFSAFPAGEIENEKTKMRDVQFKITSKIIDFALDETKNAVKRMMQSVIRPFEYKFYSDVENESSLRSQIKNGRRTTRSSYHFFALLVSRNNNELAKMHTFAERCAADTSDEGLKSIIFIVIEEVFGDPNYERFIEYQASYACAMNHGFTDQTNVYRDHTIKIVKDWFDLMLRNNATIYVNGMMKRPISMKLLSNIINSDITPFIYPYGPDAHDMLRHKAPNTFWKVQNSKEMVRTFLFAKSMEDFSNVSAQMRPIQFLLQDCLNDNLEWKSEPSKDHPFRVVYDKVNSIIKNADKSQPFNFDEKFSVLTRAPFGLYSNFAAMGMMAFALRPWVNKIFDLQGKPRDANALIDDIVLLFKVWEDGKSNDKLNFKFQTPEESKLCKGLIALFGLNGPGSVYKDVTSLKDARFAITAEFLAQRGAPLWSLKYAPDSSFKNLPTRVTLTNDIKQLIDDIVKICSERDLRNSELINETLELIGELRFDMKNILNVKNAFNDGFDAFLMQIPIVDIKIDEVEEVKQYIELNLESTVGLWTEEEVEKKAKDWRLEKQKGSKEVGESYNPYGQIEKGPSDNPINLTESSNNVNEKRNKAKNRIAAINNIDNAKAILNRLCEKGNEWVLDMIIND